MRISDWSSDVCSSDLTAFSPSRAARALRAGVLAAVFDPVTACAAPCWRRFRAIPPLQPEIVIMNDKSHVSLERHVCLVCGVAYDTCTLLLDTLLPPSLESTKTTR